MSRPFRLLLMSAFSLSTALMLALAPVYYAKSGGPSVSIPILDLPLVREGARQNDVSQIDAFRETSGTVTQRDFRRDHNMTVEMISVGPDGFQPAGLTRPSGRFLLALNNRSGLKELTFQLLREDGKLMQEARVNPKQPNWRSLVNLPAGTYRLTEVSHPHWLCNIVIRTQR